MNKSITVIGGDLRQLTLAELLSKDGFSVKVYGFGDDYISDKYHVIKELITAEPSDIIILPMPVSTDGKTINAPLNCEPISFSYIKHYIKSAKLILGGRLSNEVVSLTSGIKTIDYYKREELMIKNAVPTAEGAIEIAMNETPHTIKNCKCLIIGYGRIGKVLSRMLYDLGADVTVSARKYSDLAWIETNGYHAVHNNNIEKSAARYDIIFNTAPALILHEDILKQINPDSVIIDLASKPGGVDFEKAADLGLKVIWALSLPGKVAPLTSGKIIKDTILNILEEEGV